LTQTLSRRGVGLDGDECPASGGERGLLKGLLPGRAVDEDEVVLPRDRRETFGECEFRANGVFLGLHRQPGCCHVQVRSPDQNVEVGPYVAAWLEGTPEGQRLREGAAGIITVGRGVAELFSQVALRIEVDQ
jgi:hypothetical protein